MVIDRGHIECLLQLRNALFQQFYCFHYCTIHSRPPSWNKGYLASNLKEKKSLMCIFSLPLSHIDSFEVGACMESLDLYFLKSITYILVVCMSCIFNKPFELTLWVLQQRTSKGPLSLLFLFFSSIHLILLPFISLSLLSLSELHPLISHHNHERNVKEAGNNLGCCWSLLIISTFIILNMTDYTWAVYYLVFHLLHCNFPSHRWHGFF